MSRSYMNKEAREIDKMMTKANGFTYVSTRGDHMKYKKGNIVIPMPSKINKGVIRNMAKKYDLVITIPEVM